MTSYPQDTPGTPFGPPGSAGAPPYASPPPASVPAPSWLWAIPLAAALAVIGAATPWFKPGGTLHGQVAVEGGALYSWKDGRIGLVAPILLVILAAGVLPLLQHRPGSRFARGSTHPLIAAGRTAIGCGAATVLCTAAAYLLVTHQYQISDPTTGNRLSWDAVTKLGVTMSRGPQLGFWLTGAAGVLALVTGGLLLVTSRPSTAPAALPPGPSRSA